MNGDVGLTPLALLTDEAETQLGKVLRQVDARLQREVSWNEIEKLKLATAILLSLRYDKNTISRLINGVINMNIEIEDSSILSWANYQGMQELILELGKEKFGTPDAEYLNIIVGLQNPERLKQLARNIAKAESWQALFETE